MILFCVGSLRLTPKIFFKNRKKHYPLDLNRCQNSTTLTMVFFVSDTRNIHFSPVERMNVTSDFYSFF